MLTRLTLCSLPLLCLSCAAYSSTTPPTIESDKITVVTETWYPFSFYDERGNIAGSATETVKTILDKAGIKFTLELKQWNEAFGQTRMNQNTLLYSTLRTPIRENLFHWVCPIIPSVTHKLYKLTSRKDIKVNNMKDATKYALNVTRGAFPRDIFEKEGFSEGNNLSFTQTNDANVEMLLRGRVDLIVEAEQAIYQMLNYKGKTNDTVTEVLTYHDQISPACMAINKQTDPALVDKIKAAHKDVMLSITEEQQ